MRCGGWILAHESGREALASTVYILYQRASNPLHINISSSPLLMGPHSSWWLWQGKSVCQSVSIPGCMLYDMVSSSDESASPAWSSCRGRSVTSSITSPEEAPWADQSSTSSAAGPADGKPGNYANHTAALYVVAIASLNHGNPGLLACPSNTLFHAMTHCSTLQHTATHFNTLQHTAGHCSTLQHIATQCNTLQCIATHCSKLHRSLDSIPKW